MNELFYEIIRTYDEIERVVAWAKEGQHNGSHYPQQGYETGLREMLDWLTDSTADPIGPFDV